MKTLIITIAIFFAFCINANANIVDPTGETGATGTTESTIQHNGNHTIVRIYMFVIITNKASWNIFRYCGDWKKVEYYIDSGSNIKKTKVYVNGKLHATIKNQFEKLRYISNRKLRRRNNRISIKSFFNSGDTTKQVYYSPICK